MNRKSFCKMLIESNPHLKKMGPNEVHVFNINANYGHYQISIGPEYSAEQAKKLNVPLHSRPIEINGELHHLFVSDEGISATPSKQQIDSNLKNTVILKDLIIHIKDKKGSGSSIEIQKINFDGVHPKEKINLAGNRGKEIVGTFERSNKLNLETYKIIQYDILRALEENK